MRLKNIMLAGMGLTMLAGATSCEDRLDLVNPNQQITTDFGSKASELNEMIIACYNRIRIEGTMGRVGYLYDVVAGDEVNSYSSNDWWRAFDYNNSTSTADGTFWPMRDYYYAINTCNQALYYSENSDLDPNSDTYKQVKGQALFLRGFEYFELACYYQDIPLITDYNVKDLSDTYVTTNTQAEVLDQVEADLKEAMTLLPTRDEGGEWAAGRATAGAAAGYLARVYMFRHKFSEALSILKDIIAGTYGHYELCKDYGDNFRSTVENTAESLFEIQFLDWGVGGTDMEWTPNNNSKSSSQGQALETVFSGGDYGGGWNDLAATPWLYQTLKSQKTTAGTVDPRLYWTLITYEPDYDNMDGFANKAYTLAVKENVTNGAHKGISICKHTTARENLYQSVPASGLSCGVNICMMRYSDVLLRAAECENEISGPTQQAIDWINEVRNRAGLAGLKLSDFASKDALFEQIANVERPTEFGAEHGRFQDIIRWGWLYKADRLAQLRKHACTYWNDATKVGVLPNTPEEADDDPFSFWKPGHEYLPIYDTYMNANANLKGNSANNSTSNEAFYSGYTIHPVVEGIGIQ